MLSDEKREELGRIAEAAEVAHYKASGDSDDVRDSYWDDLNDYEQEVHRAVAEAVYAKAVEDGPRWMERPDRPGTWFLPTELSRGREGVVCHVKQYALDNWPGWHGPVYGPIPEPPEDVKGE